MISCACKIFLREKVLILKCDERDVLYGIGNSFMQNRSEVYGIIQRLKFFYQTYTPLTDSVLVSKLTH